MAKKYADLPMIAKFLLQLFLGWPIGAIYRIIKGAETKNTTVLLAGIAGIFLGFIFWIVDLFTTLLSNEISFLA